MKADEALKSSGDVARRESDGAVAVWTWDDDESPVLVHYRGQGGEHWTTAAALTGDDWQPLQTPLQRVSAASLLGYKHGVANAESDAAERIAELEADIANAVREAKRRDPDYPFTEDTASEAVWALGESLRGTEAANKDCHDRLAELEAQVAQERQWRVDAQELADKAKLELNELHKKHLVESAHAGDKIAGLGNANASFRATIADLTAKLAAVEDGSAFVGEEWFPVGSSVGQLSWLIYRGAAHKDDKMKLVQVRTENLAVAANRYFRYTGPKWAAPLPEPDQPAPEKPKCLEGVPSVLCVVSGDRDSGRAWIYGPTDGKNVAGLDCFDASPLVRSFRLSQLTVFHHAPDAAGLAEEIRKGGA